MDITYLQKPNKQLLISSFFLIGLLIFIYGLTNYSESNKKYIPVQATILSSSCIPTKAPSEPFITIFPRKKTTNMCNISVSYVVNGETYKSQIYREDEYDLGDTITIYYNQSDPSDINSVFREHDSSNLFFIFFGLAVFSLTIVYSIFFNKKGK